MDQTPESGNKKNEELDGYHWKVIKSIMNKHTIYITYRDKNIDVCFKMGFISIGLKIFEEWYLKEVI